MAGNNQICSICCSEPAIFGCVCDGDIKLIGNKCRVDHFSDFLTTHQMIDIELGITLQADADLFKDYLSEVLETSRALTGLTMHSSNCKQFKKYLQDNRSILRSELDKIFTELILKLEIVTVEINSNVRILNLYKRSLSDEGKRLLQTYKLKGETGLIKHFISKFSIPTEEIIEYLRTRISIGSLDIQEERTLEADNQILQALQEELSSKDKVISDITHQSIQKEAKKSEIERLNLQLQIDISQQNKLNQDLINKLTHMTSIIDNSRLNHTQYEENILNYRKELAAKDRALEELRNEFDNQTRAMSKYKESYLRCKSELSFKIRIIEEKNREIFALDRRQKLFQKEKELELQEYKQKSEAYIRKYRDNKKNQMKEMHQVASSYIKAKEQEAMQRQLDYETQIKSLNDIIDELRRSTMLKEESSIDCIYINSSEFTEKQQELAAVDFIQELSVNMPSVSSQMYPMILKKESKVSEIDSNRPILVNLRDEASRELQSPDNQINTSGSILIH